MVVLRGCQLGRMQLKEDVRLRCWASICDAEDGNGTTSVIQMDSMWRCAANESSEHHGHLSSILGWSYIMCGTSSITLNAPSVLSSARRAVDSHSWRPSRRVNCGLVTLCIPEKGKQESRKHPRQ